MALPEAHAEPAVQEGVCYALFAYDAGLAINLDESERRITALTQRAAIRHKRRAPRYFEYRPAPLRVTQEREVLAVGAFRTAPSVDAVLYDFGAVSVTYQIPLAGPLTRLITLAEELYESDVLRADSRRWVESLLAAIAPAVTRPGLTDFVETYVIFEIGAFTPPCAPAALYTTYGQEVARILRSERAARRPVTEGRHAGVDERRLPGHDLGDETGRGRVGRERVEDEVDARGQIRQHARRLRMLQRERHAELARVHRVPVEAVLAAVPSPVAGRQRTAAVAPRRLDLDHQDAQVGEQPAAQVAERVGQIERAEPGERRRHAAGYRRPTRRGTNGIRISTAMSTMTIHSSVSVRRFAASSESFW